MPIHMAMLSEIVSFWRFGQRTLDEYNCTSKALGSAWASTTQKMSGHPESNRGPSDHCKVLQSDALPTELYPACPWKIELAPPQQKQLRQVAASIATASVPAASIVWLCDQFKQSNKLHPVMLESTACGS